MSYIEVLICVLDTLCVFNSRTHVPGNSRFSYRLCPTKWATALPLVHTTEYTLVQVSLWSAALVSEHEK
jgi:hypothetical protein